MPYNEKIDDRIKNIVSGRKNISRKKMFGGICYLIEGKMFCGVYRDFLILRLGEEKSLKEMESPFTRQFDITGRPMKGWVMVEGAGFNSERKLKSLLDSAEIFTAGLPPK